MRLLTLSLISTLMMIGRADAGFQSNGVQANGVQANGVQANGVQANGVQANGVQANGVQANGVQANGVQANGVQTDGVSYNGIQVNGTQLSYIGQSTSAFAYSCAHREDVAGAALNNCSACSMTVANADPYCRNYSWDSICVSEARSMCNLGAGTVLTASFTNGQTARMRIDSTSTGAASSWNGSVYMNMSDVQYNRMSWVLDHAPNVVGTRLLAGSNSCVSKVVNEGGAGYGPDPYCANVAWDSLCVAEANAICGAASGTEAPSSTTGASVCGTTGGGTPIQAIFLAGTWDQRWGIPAGGDKTASSTMFTIACRGVGAYAKCVDMGYKPWTSAANDQLHQACVRMVRADYCGDGSSFTRDGEQINVEDINVLTSAADIQTVTSNPSGWYFDGGWNTNGAVLVGMRQSRSWETNVYSGENLLDYNRDHCNWYMSEWLSGNWFGAHSSNTQGILITNSSPE